MFQKYFRKHEVLSISMQGTILHNAQENGHAQIDAIGCLHGEKNS